MANKIIRFSPKIEIINHFDELINRVDIEFEECLEKYNEQHVLDDLECFEKENRKRAENVIRVYYPEIVSLFESERICEKQTDDLWSESTKVVDYLKQIRMRTIEELKKGKEQTLEYYNLNSSPFKDIINDNEIEELRSILFAEKFYFQIRITKEKKPWIFNLFTFVTDFYMSQSDINVLE